MRPILILLTFVAIIGGVSQGSHTPTQRVPMTSNDTMQVNTEDIVKKACDKAHKEIGPSEAYCAQLQEQYNMQYVCSDTAPDAYCWVEAL